MEKYKISHGYLYFKIIPNELVPQITSSIFPQLINIDPNIFIFGNINNYIVTDDNNDDEQQPPLPPPSPQQNQVDIINYEIANFIFQSTSTNKLCYQLNVQETENFSQLHECEKLTTILDSVDFSKNKLFLFAGFGVNHNLGIEFVSEYPTIHAFNFIFNTPLLSTPTYFYSFDNNVRDNFYESTAFDLFKLVMYIRINRKPFYSSYEAHEHRQNAFRYYNNYVYLNKSMGFKYFLK